ncbi:MAG: hypothetical protein OEV42_12240 [Deltaproteobacteria bacterium]|nr:hypothetical protein [Deltaproteobacteria bacterium]
MLNKKPICEFELLNILNDELKKHPECKYWQFVSVQRIIPDNPLSSNWSEAELRCSGHPVRDYKPIAFRIVTEAQSKYRLK